MPRFPNDYDAARTQGRLWTPTAMRPSVRLWLDADQPDSLTFVSGAISQWNDLSGRGLHATQSTAGNRPTWNGWGGGVRFTSSSSQSMAGSQLWTGILGEFCVVVLSAAVSLANGFLFTLNPPSLSPGRIVAHTPWGDGNVYWDVGQAGAPERISAAWGGTTGTPHLWTLVSSFARGVQYFSRDGNQLASDASGAEISADAGGYTIGGVAPSNYDGNIYEMVFVDTTNDITTRQLEGYMAWKWGRQSSLAAGHPYRNAPPLLGV